jgi:hypothetical protein
MDSLWFKKEVNELILIVVDIYDELSLARR